MILKEIKNLVIISNRNLTIKSSVSIMYKNNAHHCYYYYHIKQNLVINIHNEALNKYFKKITYAYNENKFKKIQT